MTTGDCGRSDSPSGWCHCRSHIAASAPFCLDCVAGHEAGLCTWCKATETSRWAKQGETCLLAITNHLDGFFPNFMSSEGMWEHGAWWGSPEVTEGGPEPAPAALLFHVGRTSPRGSVPSQEATDLCFPCSILCGIVCKRFLVLKVVVSDTLNMVFSFLSSETCYR